MEKLQPVRGTKDLLAEDDDKHDAIIDVAKNIANIYGYQGLSLPIFEFSGVFKRSLGESSDVVGKEMYIFLDKGAEEITLRPEFTASVCRAFISNGWKRQFHQLNYEFFGPSTPEVDAEIISMAANLLDKIGVLKDTTLELNSLGCSDTRKKYQLALVEYFKKFENDLSDDSKVRLYKNPLRILDSKDENDKKLLSDAPRINDYFTIESKEFFEKLQEHLKMLNISFNLNTALVRGLDYYNHTAFEFVTTSLGAQGTVLGGGRYNGLVKLMGGDETSAVGFAAGIERLALLSDLKKVKPRSYAVIALDEAQMSIAIKIANELRKKNIHVQLDYGQKFDKALKNAIKCNCIYAIFLGEEELKNASVKLKN